MGVYSRTTKNGNAKWYIRYFADGKLRREVTPARTRKQAEYFLAKRRVEVEEGKWSDQTKKRVKFHEWAIDYFELKQLQGLKSIDRVELSLKHLTDFFGDFYLDAITEKNVLRYIKKRKNTKLKRSPYTQISYTTINRELACLKNMLNEAIKQRIINPITPLPHIRLFREDNARNRYLSDEEYSRLLGVCPPHIYGLVLCAYETGMRRGEIISLTWDRVDLRKGFIHLSSGKTKTGCRRKIPISKALDEYLRSVPRSIGTDHVFHYRGKPINYSKEAWKTALKRAGIKDFRFHDLRHTFVTRMRRAGVHDHVIMAITGHKTQAMFRRYDTVDGNDLLEAVHKTCAPRYSNADEKSTSNMQRGDTRGDTRAEKRIQRKETRGNPSGTPACK